jgi:hypothetical protein
LSFVVSPFVGRLLGLNSARQYRGRKTTAAWSENGTRSRQEGDRNPAAPQCGHARLSRRWCQSRLNTLQQSSAIRPISSSPGFASLKILSTNDAARGDMARRYWHVRFVRLGHRQLRVRILSEREHQPDTAARPRSFRSNVGSAGTALPFRGGAFRQPTPCRPLARVHGRGLVRNSSGARGFSTCRKGGGKSAGASCVR